MRTILLVEDDQISREMLSRRLKRIGYDVRTAENGREGVALALSEGPSLILMDLCMPEMDGFMATRQIRSEPRMGDVPIIALTALNARGDVMTAIEAGCDAYETKPVVMPRLLAKIRTFLDALETDP
jgi:CheY-like chemotaxis protein